GLTASPVPQVLTAPHRFIADQLNIPSLTTAIGLRQTAITGQCLPILVCIKYCALQGRSGYFLTNPTIGNRARIPALVGARSNARWISRNKTPPRVELVHHRCSWSQPVPICTQARTGTTLSGGKKSS